MSLSENIPVFCAPLAMRHTNITISTNNIISHIIIVFTSFKTWIPLHHLKQNQVRQSECSFFIFRYHVSKRMPYSGLKCALLIFVVLFFHSLPWKVWLICPDTSLEFWRFSNNIKSKSNIIRKNKFTAPIFSSNLYG